MSQPKIDVRDVYKVFGPSREQARAVELLRQGQDKSSVQTQTGCNVGLAGVSLGLPAGDISCIMGLSGSGKSTLVRHLNRLIDPTSGEILVHGPDILMLDLPALRALRRTKLRMVFEHLGRLPYTNLVD